MLPRKGRAAAGEIHQAPLPFQRADQRQRDRPGHASSSPLGQESGSAGASRTPRDRTCANRAGPSLRRAVLASARDLAGPRVQSPSPQDVQPLTRSSATARRIPRSRAGFRTARDARRRRRRLDPVLVGVGIGGTGSCPRSSHMQSGCMSGSKPLLTRNLRQRQCRSGDICHHLEEVVVKFSGKTFWLWRVVDQHGADLDEILQPWRDRWAAKRHLRKLMKCAGSVSKRIITDNLSSNGAAECKLVPGWIIGRTKGSTITLRTANCRYKIESA